jgi:hypothetical protein
MDRSNQRSEQHLDLAMAAATVHIRTRGVPPDPARPTEMHSVLNDVAHAIAMVVPVYVADDDGGIPKELDASELLGGEFSRGAQMFTTKSGKGLRGLTVRRCDMEFAITILKPLAGLRKQG